MKSSATTYLITRVHGLKTHLVGPDELATMVKARGLKEVVEVLLKTEYADQVSVIPEESLDAATLERLFKKKLVSRAYFLLKAAPQSLHPLLQAYYRRFEVENLKRILRAKHAGEPIGEESLIPLEREHTLINFSALMDAEDVLEAIDLLRETVYSPLSKKIDLYNEYKTPLVLEACLDHIYYTSLWKILDKTPVGREVRNHFAIEVDFRNLLMILSMKMRGVDAGFIEQNLTPVRGGLSRRLLSDLIKGRVEDAPSLVKAPSYRKLLTESVDLYNKGFSSELETFFTSQYYKIVSQTFKRHQSNLVYVFSYLYLCEAEARNLVAISLCKELETEEGELKKLIFT